MMMVKLVKLSISKVDMNVIFNCLFLKRLKVEGNQHFFIISKRCKTPKTNNLLVLSLPSNSNYLGSDKILILILIIRIHGVTNYSDLFRIRSELDSIPNENKLRRRMDKMEYSRLISMAHSQYSPSLKVSNWSKYYVPAYDMIRSHLYHSTGQ